MASRRKSGMMGILLCGAFALSLPNSTAQVPPPVPQPANSAPGSISGHVYRADTEAPLAGAIVTLTPHDLRTFLTNNAGGFPPPPPTIRTGSDGAYTFASIDPGSYRIQISQRGGFVAPSPQIAFVTSGKATPNTDFRLALAAPVVGSFNEENQDGGGVIYGSVHDQDDVPLNGMRVTTYCGNTPAPGEDRPRTRQVVTDDWGNFLISGLPAGDCYVGAGTQDRDPLSQAGYGSMFYPDAKTMEKAQNIPVRPGETEKINLVVRYSPICTITVKVKENGNETDAIRYRVGVISAEPGAMAMVNSPQSGNPPFVMTRPDGTAVVRGVSSGRYMILLYPVRELTGAPGPTIRHRDGTVDTVARGAHHAWGEAGPARGGAEVQVAGQDLSIEIPLSTFPPGGAMGAGPFPRQPTQQFCRKLSAGESVCGPLLTYRNGNTVRQFQERVSEQGFSARRDAGGHIMIKEGPLVIPTSGGTGECGACPRVGPRILALDANLDLITLLDIEETIDRWPHPASADFTVSPDYCKRSVLAVWTGLILAGILPSGHSAGVHLEVRWMV